MIKEKLTEMLKNPEALAETITDLMTGKTNLGQMAGFDSEQLDFIYHQAVIKYESSAIDSAIELLRSLCFFDMTNPRNWRALAQCYQAKKDYALAIVIYSQSAVFDPDTAFILYQIAHCNVQMREFESAKLAIDEAEEALNKEKDKDRADLEKKIASLKSLIYTNLSEKGQKNE